MRFPTLRAAAAAAAAAAAPGPCLPALPTALSPPKYSYQIVDAIFIYPPLVLRKICWGSPFFSILLVGIEPGLLTPKSLRLTFTPLRHTTFVFCLCLKLLLITIAMMLQIILGIYGFIHTP